LAKQMIGFKEKLWCVRAYVEGEKHERS